MRKNLLFYLPYLLILTFLVFVFCTLLSLASGSSQIYKKSGSKDLLAVFEGNRACVFASLVPETYRERIEGVPHIVDITGEVRHMIVYGPKSSLTLTGVEPEKFRYFKPIRISDKEYSDFINDKKGVIIGKKVHRSFKWKNGENVTLQGLNFNVRGVFKMPLSVYNGMIVFHKDYLQELVKKKGFFTAFTIKIDSPANVGVVSKDVERLFTDHPSGIVCAPETVFWGRTEKQMGGFGTNMRTLARLCGLFVFSVVANAVLFMGKKRKRDLKKLISEGFSRKSIFSSFLIEPIAAVTIAGIAGGLLAYGIWIKQPTIGGDQAILPPIAISPYIIVISIMFLFAFAIVPGIYSALKYTKE
ncbi:ABC transporter permease [Acidobacteriota bacterium]